MSKFSDKGGKEPPKVSTASLPDIVFMLLFFFMVTTVLRDAELKVAVQVPQATELTKLEQKSLVHYLYLGKPTKKYQALYGTSPSLQLGDKISNISDIPIFIEKHDNFMFLTRLSWFFQKFYIKKFRKFCHQNFGFEIVQTIYNSIKIENF